MKYAFSPAGIAKLKKFGAGRALFAFDYDGTLAPVVEEPERALIPAPTMNLLRRLSELAPTAAVTGRPLAVIRTLVPASFTAWAGNHGAEIFPHGRRKPASAASKRRVRLWSTHLKSGLKGLPGVWVETKEFSICVHYRSSPSRAAARSAILREVAALDPGPRVLAGKCVVNLLAPELPHKGRAVQELLRSFRLTSAIYVGDDENDEDVFALADPRVCSVRVGLRAGSRAALYLKRQSEINRLLRLLVSLRDQPGSRYRGRR